VAVAVIAVVIWLFVSAGRRREVEARRFEAGELRAKVEERLPQLQDSEDRASVTAAMAADALTDAERKAAEAKRLEEQAQAHRASAEAAREKQAALEREADRVDPDVRTDPEGYRLDERGERFAGQEPSRSGAGAGGAGAAGAAAVGAAAFTQDDEEDDLADAENPFASPAETTSSVTDEGTDQGSDKSSYASEEPEVTGGATSSESAWAPSEPADHSEAGADEEEAEAAGDEAGDVKRDDGSLGTGEETDQSARDERDTDVSDNLSSALDADDEDNGAAAVGSAGAGSAAGADEEAAQVRVPALEDRDEVLADGGTPDDDPGDHRGQAWATTPGMPGPGDSAEPADEGIDVDMAPHSHESDETDEPDEAVGSTAQEPRREEAEPAPDVAAAAYPDTDASTDTSTDTSADTGTDASADASTDTSTDASTDTSTDTNADEPATAENASPSGRRVSAFDEVVDGGFGLGSAAPIEDGAQPLGHVVKGTRDGKSFLAPDDAGYDDLEPDVWFYNEDAARRAGFHREGD